MSSECWWRSPRLYIRELVECGSSNIIFDRGTLIKYRLNALEFVHAHYGQALPYRLIVVDNNTAAEYTYEKGEKHPIASYPVWHYGEEQTVLEELLAMPVGQDNDLCFDLETEVHERPVLNQEHRIIIADLPTAMGISRRFRVFLKDMQEAFPEAIIHLHGAYAWNVCFGQGLRAADSNPRDWAAHGEVMLPGGKRIHFEKVQAYAKWITMLGFTPGDLASPRNRCMYNIKSGEWAARNFLGLTKFAPVGKVPTDTDSPEAAYKQPTRLGILPRDIMVMDGDKQICSMCSLAPTCSYFRDGAVCSLPDAETTPLANFFNTRDSTTIIEGLGVLLAHSSRRLQRGAATEEAIGDLDPEVSKLSNTIFAQAVTLAKLVDPNLRSSPVKINVNQGSGSQALVAASTPQELTGAIVRELEQRGIARDKITPKMIQGLLEGMSDPEKKNRAIDGVVSSERSLDK